MKKSLILCCSIIAIIVALTTSCKNKSSKNNADSKDSLSGTISISGAFALYPLTVKWADEYMKLYPKVTIDVSAGGAGKGMTDALSGMIDLGMFSKAVSNEEKQNGAWWIAVTKDAVLATINTKNPEIESIKTNGLTMEKFYDIFITNKIKNWGTALNTKSKAKINVYTRSDACGAAEMWAKYLNGKKQEDLQGIGVNGDPGVADAVKKDVNGIGFNNIAYVFDIKTRKKYEGMAVVPIDINKNGKIEPEENVYNSLDEIMAAIKDGRYPSPPARDLFFVCKGKPQKAVITHFLNWVLTDGQKYVNEAGYVLLSEESIKTELGKIK
ncbi:MAG: substrate-binding domain-containing protein [Bacteroidetes bacterium]|nr:substrate-binding domain-containing protein [Bacteroidota bacterium]